MNESEPAVIHHDVHDTFHMTHVVMQSGLTSKFQAKKKSTEIN